MPPTAVEIKARLDKAVDQEGNVLDVKAALEIMNYLETNVITKEALETTRIGKTINLMRKKTTNEDLAKRAKKLVRKWQLLISNHLRTLQAESPRPVTPPQPGTPPNINGTSVKRKNVDRPNSRTGTIDHLNKANLKRKRTNTGDSPLNVKQGLSPKLSITRGSSRSPVGRLQKNEADRCRASSPSQIPTITTVQNNNNKPFNSDHTNTENALVKNETSDVVTHVSSIKNRHNKHSNEVLKATDTRCQEDRITRSGDYESGGVCDSLCEERDLTTNKQTTENLDTKLLSTENSHSAGSTQCVTGDELVSHDENRTFEPIPEENLSVKRKDVPEDHISPDTEADGVNGVYDGVNRWRSWTEIVTQRDDNLQILPYVILE